MPPQLRSLVVTIVLSILTGLALPSDTTGSRQKDGRKDRVPVRHPGSAVPGKQARAGPESVPDEILVTCREAAADSECRASLSAAGHTVLRRFHSRRDSRAKQNRLYLVRIGPGQRLEAALAAIRQLPAVEEAQPNFIYRASQAPDDPYYYLQWGQENVGDNSAHTMFGLHGPDPRLSGADMDAESARNLYSPYPMQEVIVAVIDTGVAWDHPDLAPIVWVNPGEIPGNGLDDDGNGYTDDIRGWDFASEDNDPLDENGHGTHVSGVVGAVGDNGAGVAGTAGNVTIMPLRFLGADGSGSTSDAIDAILYGIENGARVLNASWGGGAFDPALQDAIAQAGTAGVLFVAAAGNEASDNDLIPSYPANYDLENVISVAASTPWGDMADFSNRGRVTVDIAAPGDEIISTTPTYGPAGVPETAYQIGFPTSFEGLAPWSGTSMAAPAVSGAAALLFGLGDSLWPDWPVLSPAERAVAVRARILERASRWPSLGATSVTEGHLNLYNLVEGDGVPPGSAGASLRLVARGSQFVTLRWTATGDDGLAGNANYYDLRYQPGPAILFDTAIPAGGVWTPASPGSYEHFTLTGLQPGTDYTFGLEVVDNAGNRSERTELTVTTLPANVFFTDDMEAGTNGWTGGWTMTTESSSSPAHSWTDSPGGSYGGDWNVSLTSPEIPTDGSTLTMTFTHRYDTEPGYDYCYVEARAYAGGVWGPWTILQAFTGTHPAWSGVTAGLPVTGEKVQIQFRLRTDSTVEADGWHVDDVALFSSTGTAPGTLLFEDTLAGNDCSRWSLAGLWGCESDALSDSPGASYPVNNRASARIGPLNLSGTLAAEVSFDLRSFDYEDGYDFLFFEYSLDGTGWRRLDRLTGSLGGTRTYPLNDLVGMPSVYFRFRSLADYGIQVAGAQIDAFRVMVAEIQGCTVDADCDDGLLCNGTETCDTATGGCVAAPPPPVVPSLTLSGDTLSWTPVEGATGYDVVAGDLIGLAEGGMSAATTGCVADDAPPSSILIGTVPPLGAGFWYLVRGVNCGGSGSYGAGDPPPPLSRDEAIALSGNDCIP